MKQIIFKDGDHERVIELREKTNIDELFYRIYRFQRKNGWFDFDWTKVNELENVRLHELIPDLQHFTYEGKTYESDLSWHCHLYSMELGKNSITMADKIVIKFYKIIKQDEFPPSIYAKYDTLLHQIALARAKVTLNDRTLSMQQPGQAEYSEIRAKATAEQAELDELLAKRQALRNPYWVPGVSGNGGKIKFTLSKHGSERSICNLMMKDCEHGIPEKVKKTLLKQFEKDPNFTFTLRMFLVFDYLDAVPEGSRSI